MQREKDYLEREFKRFLYFLEILIDKLSNSKTKNSGLQVNDIELQLKGQLDFSIFKFIDLDEDEFTSKLNGFNSQIIEKLIDLMALMIEKDLANDTLKKKLIEKIICMIDFLDKNSNVFSVKRMNLRKQLINI